MEHSEERYENSIDQRESSGELQQKSLYLLRQFPYTLVIKIVSSEPRDVLNLEITCLLFIQFSTSLFMSALGVMLNFRLDTSGNAQRGRDNSSNITAISFMLVGLSLVVMVVAGINYFVSVDRYARHKVRVQFSKFISVFSLTSTIVILIAINLYLIVDELRHDD